MVQIIKIHILSSSNSPPHPRPPAPRPGPPENHAVYEIMWKIMVELDSPQMTIWRMRIACWIPKATNTHSGCVMLTVFRLQQWLHELSSVLRYTCSGCLVRFQNITRFRGTIENLKIFSTIPKLRPSYRMCRQLTYF